MHYYAPFTDPLRATEDDSEDDDVRSIPKLADHSTLMPKLQQVEEDDIDSTVSGEQRRENGVQMFQMFAARMFESRVLQAYREKVARERQEQLLMELAEEDQAAAGRDAKKLKDAQKKKAKKQYVDPPRVYLEHGIECISQSSKGKGRS